MNKRTILAILVILVILVALVLVKFRTQKPPRSLREEYELESLVPEDFLISEVTRVELYSPPEEEKKVRLDKVKGKWKVASRFSAPGDKDKIESFLSKIKQLQGELRSATKAVLPDFQLGEGEGIHILISRKGKPALHLVVGKKMGAENRFIRRQSEYKVYVVPFNLEVTAEEISQSPVWVEKTILGLDKDKIEEVTLKYPDKEISFVKEESKSEEGEAEKKEKEEIIWKVVGGKTPAGFKEDKFKRLLENLAFLEAEDVADPQKLTEWGLDNPAYLCQIKLDKGKEINLAASHKDLSGPGYLIVDNNRQLIYQLSDYDFKDIFPAGKKLFELKGWDLEEEKIREITLKDGERSYHFAQDKEEQWQLEKPQAEGELKTDTVEEIAEEFASLEPEDFAQGSLKDYGLAKPLKTIKVKLESNQEHSLKLGHEAKVIEGNYVQLDEQDTIYVIKKKVVKKLFPAEKDILPLK